MVTNVEYYGKGGEKKYAVSVGSYGFENVENAFYSIGHFTTWEEMKDSATQVALNSIINRSTFIPGEEYTFCFKENGKDYFEYLTIE